MPKRRRRAFTGEFKAQIVLEVLAQIVLKILMGLKSPSEVVRRHKLKPELITRWKDIALEGPESLFQGEGQRDQDQDRSAERGRVVGRVTMELGVSKRPQPCSPWS